MNGAAGSGADLHGPPTTGRHGDLLQDYYYYHYSPPGEGGGLYRVSPPVGGEGPQYHLEKSQYHLEKYQKLKQQYSPVDSCSNNNTSSHGLPPSHQSDHQLKDHHHHHHQVLQGAAGVPAPRQCRLGLRRLTSMGYGVMLCTFLWVFLYTLTFSCCVGNSRLEVVGASSSSSSHGGGGGQGGGDYDALVAGSTRRLQHDLHHRRREAPLLQGGGRDHGARGDGRGSDGGDEGGVRRGVGYSFIQGGVVPGRKLEEDEDDTIYTLPDEERAEGLPPKHRSTYEDQEGGDNDDSPDQEEGGNHHHERYVLNRADDQHHADDRGADETGDDYRPGHPPRTHPRHDSARHSNRRDSKAPPTGDNNSSKTNSLNNPPSDSSNNSNHHNKNRIKYDNGKPPRRRGGGAGGGGGHHGRGSRSRGLDPSDWTKEGYSRKLPHGLIIGVKKGGTRALLEFLRVHPDIRAPGPEPHFFDRNYDKGLEWYRSQMPPTLDSQLTLEKTPSYFVTKGVPGRIFNMSRNIKLIVVVRDPVTRAISDYTQSSSKRTDVKAFEEMAFLDNSTGLVDTSWGAIRIGVYAKHLERWLRYFPLTQIHFVSGERLISDPAAELAKVQDFLGLKRVITDKHFYFNSTKGFPCLKKPEGSGNPHCLGKTKGRPHPKVDPKVIKRLHDFYRPFNAKFYQMTNLDFSWP